MREIQFPDTDRFVSAEPPSKDKKPSKNPNEGKEKVISAIDSACFLNGNGDLLISHSQRISLIKFETYWTKIFDHYGITKAEPTENSSQVDPDESDKEIVIEEVPPKRFAIDSNATMSAAFKGALQKKKDEE